MFLGRFLELVLNDVEHLDGGLDGSFHLVGIQSAGAVALAIVGPRNAGLYQRLNTEWSVAGDARYLKANYQIQQYIPLNKQFTVALNGELGWGKGLNGQPFPVFKNFYSGGLGSVRGFDQGTLGPRDVTGSSVGGPKKVTLNAELIAPFPGAGNDKGGTATATAGRK